MASALTWPIDDAAVSKFVGPPLEVVSVDSYRWVVIVGGILAFSMAWGIGANDIANAFATSVGSGALTLRWACIIGAVMEFSGAILLGSHVTDTVRSKIIDGDSFDPVKGGSANGPELLMTAFMCALLSATIWLVVATYLELPVSTTHSIIGSLVGTGMVYRGPDSVNWISEGSGLNKMNGVVGIVLSWIISPLLSGIFAVSLFIIVRTLVLRAKNPVRNCYIFLPFFYAFTVAIACFFIIYKGSPRLGLDKKLNAAQCVGIALGTGAVVGVLSYLLLIPLAKKWIARWEAEELEKSKNPEAALEAAYKCAKVDTALAKVGVNVRLKDELDDDVIQLHDNVEKFDPKTEKLFTWLQVFTSSFDSFAHGANDVANAIGPFASIYQLWQGAGVISAVKTGEFARDLTLKGGLRDGEKVEAGDALPDGSAFCGNVDGVEYFKCKLNFPSTTLLAEGSKSAEFELYNAVGVAQGITKCNTKCGPGNSAKYTSVCSSVAMHSFLPVEACLSLSG
jgi:solute carrier family 20 (sodium-dependent phosphate transporter)